MSWTEYVSNDNDLGKIEAKRTYNRHQLKFLGLIKRKEGLENMANTGSTENKNDRGKQHESYVKLFAELGLVEIAKRYTN